LDRRLRTRLRHIKLKSSSFVLALGVHNGGGASTGKLKVFISYSRVDAAFAKELKLDLEDKGYTVGIDEESIPRARKPAVGLRGPSHAHKPSRKAATDREPSVTTNATPKRGKSARYFSSSG